VRETLPCVRFAREFESALNVLIAAYIEAALWSSELDANYSADDISGETLVAMAADCFTFLAAPHVLAAISAADSRHAFQAHGGAWSEAGHDLWFTRNGHGVGFWESEWTAAI
jgi:hypothetical protein